MHGEMMGTKPVPEGQRFDADALGAWLAANVDGYPDGPLAVEQFKGGQSNDTFRLGAGFQVPRQYALCLDESIMAAPEA